MATKAERRFQIIDKYEKDIHYSLRYQDDYHEYRHVVLPKEIAAFVIKDRLMTEDEWRALGVRQSPGWHHYMIHEPEPHILLFKRDLDPEQKLEIQKKKLQNLHNGNKVLNLNNNNKQNLNNDKNDANDKELSDINVGGMAG